MKNKPIDVYADINTFMRPPFFSLFLATPRSGKTYLEHYLVELLIGHNE